jgi:hypothetical protein
MMQYRAWVAVSLMVLFVVGCGDEEEGPDPEPTRCGGLHWNDADSRDGYTGCEGVEGDWTCECGVEPSMAFQGDTSVSNDSADNCAQAVAQSCSTTLPLVTPCAGISGPATCWHVADEEAVTAPDKFDCRCERAVAPQQVDADSCQAALQMSCE